MKYTIWHKWDPLQVCMLGNTYFPEYFDTLDQKVANLQKRISEETLEDIDNFKKILKDFGIDVIQPSVNSNDRFVSDFTGPLNVRQHQLVLGNKCYSYNRDHSSIYKSLSDYSAISKLKYKIPNQDEYSYNMIAGDDFPSYKKFNLNRTNKQYFKDFVWKELLDNSKCSYMSSRFCFMIGNKLHIGKLSTIDGTLSQNFLILPEDFKLFDTKFIDGHIDKNFHPLKPGVILSLQNVKYLEENYPGWDICYIEGYTDFDTNILMLDENHCCVSNINNKQVNNFFKKHKIEQIYVPWRHRHFWDCGLHNITLDLYRKGKKQNYFEFDKNN